MKNIVLGILYYFTLYFSVFGIEINYGYSSPSSPCHGYNNEIGKISCKYFNNPNSIENYIFFIIFIMVFIITLNYLSINKGKIKLIGEQTKFIRYFLTLLSSFFITYILYNLLYILILNK